MNVILLPSEAQQQSTWSITDPRLLQHITTILKPTLGDTLKVGVLGGNLGRALVSEISASRVVLSDLSLHTPPPAKLPLTLVVALPRPKVLRRLVSDAVAIGVEHLVFIHSYTVEKSYWQSPFLEKLTEYAQLGLEQTVDTVLPTISVYKRFKPFVEDVFPELISNKTALVAHPYAQTVMPAGINTPSILVIGAEGGFIPYEINCFEQAGASAVSLGGRILRTEAVINSAIGRLFTR